MKIARDRLNQLRHDGIVYELWNWIVCIVCGNATRRIESWLALRLAIAMLGAKRDGAAARVWEAQWKTVYSLADAVCERHVDVACAYRGAFKERVVSRL